MVVSMFGISICLIVIPLITDLWLLCLVILAPGIFCGFIAIGLQAIILQVWGPEKSRPLIQSFHFMYTIGAFLAPLIMGPFLELANEGGVSTEAPCPGEPSEPIDIDLEQLEQSRTYILYGFAITSGFAALAGCMWVLLTVWGVLDQIKEDHDAIKDTRVEENARVIWPFLAAVCAFFFNIVTTESIFGAYIYNYSRCSIRTGMDSKEASTALTIFTGCMMAGRFSKGLLAPVSGI